MVLVLSVGLVGFVLRCLRDFYAACPTLMHINLLIKQALMTTITTIITSIITTTVIVIIVIIIICNFQLLLQYQMDFFFIYWNFHVVH